LSKRGLILVCSVNIVSTTSSLRTLKNLFRNPQRNCTFMNSLLVCLFESLARHSQRSCPCHNFLLPACQLCFYLFSHIKNYTEICFVLMLFVYGLSRVSFKISLFSSESIYFLFCYASMERKKTLWKNIRKKLLRYTLYRRRQSYVSLVPSYSGWHYSLNRFSIKKQIKIAP
jgi:hypothetical protein